MKSWIEALAVVVVLVAAWAFVIALLALCGIPLGMFAHVFWRGIQLGWRIV